MANTTRVRKVNQKAVPTVDREQTDSTEIGSSMDIDWGNEVAAKILQQLPQDVPAGAAESSKRTALNVKKVPLIKPPIPWERTDPPLVLGSANQPFFGGNEHHPMDIVHASVFGATGSGKTQNVVIPFVKASLAYQLHDGTKASVFVLDPKKELIEGIRTTLNRRGEADRLVVIGECAPLQLFPSDCQLSAKDRFERFCDIAPPIEDLNNSSWVAKTKALLLSMLELEMTYFERSGKRLIQTLALEMGVVPSSCFNFWRMFQGVLGYTCRSHAQLKQTYEWLSARCESEGIISQVFQLLNPYMATSDLIEQFSYLVQIASPVFQAMSNPTIEQFVDLDVLGNSIFERTNVETLIVDAKVIVFAPELTEAHIVAAKALKERMFSGIYSRQNLKQPMYFIADEYQTFVSPKDVELLDRSRGYRVVSCLASQSVASLKHALASFPKSSNVVDVILTNTPTRFSFKTTDAETAGWLRTQIPNSSEGPHILDVRRMSTLRSGEAYYMFSDGSWGMDRPPLALAA
jgi:hypothetical protein